MKWSIFPRKFLWFLIVTLYLIVASASLPSIFVSFNKAPTIAISSPFLLEAAYWFSSFFMCSFHCFTRSLIHLNSKNRSQRSFHRNVQLVPVRFGGSRDEDKSHVLAYCNISFLMECIFLQQCSAFTSLGLQLLFFVFALSLRIRWRFIWSHFVSRSVPNV